MMVLLAACIPVLESPENAVPFAVPENTWGTCVDAVALEDEGWSTGERPPDFRMRDQHGDETALYQFQECRLTLVDVSTMWCSPCQVLAEDVQATADAYRDQGFRYLTVLAQDMGSDPPDTDELNLWGDTYGIAEPILSDAAGWYQGYIPDDTFPGLFLLDQDLRLIETIAIPADEQIRSAIEANL